MIFLKLGGSLITDKTGVEAERSAAITQLAAEIAAARVGNSGSPWLLGHGGGSFGHVAAAKNNTRQGVKSPEQWLGFAAVHAAMVRLNRLLVDALLETGVPAYTIAPSAILSCENGRISEINPLPLQTALAAGLLPVIHGDVAFDRILGGTIVSTEEVMEALVPALQPQWLLLAGETDGVYDDEGQTVPLITPANFAEYASALGGSRGTDVTGGMASKVQAMLDLVRGNPALKIRIFSGLQPGNGQRLLSDPEFMTGTVIQAMT